MTTLVYQVTPDALKRIGKLFSGVQNVREPWASNESVIIDAAYTLLLHFERDDTDALSLQQLHDFVTLHYRSYYDLATGRSSSTRARNVLPTYERASAVWFTALEYLKRNGYVTETVGTTPETFFYRDQYDGDIRLGKCHDHTVILTERHKTVHESLPIYPDLPKALSSLVVEFGSDVGDLLNDLRYTGDVRIRFKAQYPVEDQ
jgi:hypothetical protein